MANQHIDEPFVFSYKNWEFFCGYSPFLTQREHELLKEYDGHKTEMLSSEFFLLRTRIKRFYFPLGAVKRKGEQDIEITAYLQAQKTYIADNPGEKYILDYSDGKGMMNRLFNSFYAEYKSWPSNFSTIAFIADKGFAAVKLTDVQKLSFQLVSDIYPLNDAEIYESRTDYLPDNYILSFNGELENDNKAFLCILPLYRILGIMRSIKPTVAFSETLEQRIESIIQSLQKKRNDQASIKRYEEICQEILHVFSQQNDSESEQTMIEKREEAHSSVDGEIPLPTQIYDVFISYRRSDGVEIAKEIAGFLTSKGLRVFLDLNEMVNGHYFDQQIREHIMYTPNFILIGTEDAFRFRHENGEDIDYVAEEIRLALKALDSDPKNRLLLPVLAPGVTFPQSGYADGTIRISKVDAMMLRNAKLSESDKKKILQAVTHINRINVWHAAQRWLYIIRKPGRRFYQLRIDDRLLPCGTMLDINKSDQSISSSNNDDSISVVQDEPVTQLLRKTCGNLFITAEGGMGKTTLLLYIMDRAYDHTCYSNTTQIPVFIELSKAPDTYGRLYESGVSTFIRRAIYQQIRTDKYVKQINKQEIGGIDEAFMSDPDIAVIPINSLLTEKSGSPEFLLLLDGINELSRIRLDEVGKTIAEMVTSEILWISNNCPNVQLIVTSRYDDYRFNGGPFTRVFLTGLHLNNAIEYIASKRPSGKEYLINNPSLLHALRIPLFTYLFSELGDTERITSAGELLRLYYNEKMKNIMVYTSQDRIEQITEDVSRASSSIQRRRMDSDIQSFILDFILPSIAWAMVKTEQYQIPIRSQLHAGRITVQEAIDLTLNITTGNNDNYDQVADDVFGKYASKNDTRVHFDSVRKKLLTLYAGESEIEQALDVLRRYNMQIPDEMRVHSAKQAQMITEEIVDYAVMTLGILRHDESLCEFFHPVIRDYFAAVWIANQLTLAQAYIDKGLIEPAEECLTVISQELIEKDILRFVGEYFGENKRPSGASSVVTDIIDYFRNRFDGEASIAARNLVTIIATARGKLSDCDLSSLDLRDCNFCGIRLGGMKKAAVFAGAVLSDTCFSDPGENENGKGMHKAVFSFIDNKYLLSNNSIISIEESQVVETLEYHGKYINPVGICEDCSRVFTINEQGNGEIWFVNPLRFLCQLEGQLPEHALYYLSVDGRRLVAAGLVNEMVLCWDCDNGKLIFKKKVAGTGVITDVSFSSDSKLVAFSIYNHMRFEPAKIFNTETGEQCINLSYPWDDINTTRFSPDNKKMITTSDDGRITVWSRTGKLLLSFMWMGRLKEAFFSADGKYIIVRSASYIALFNAKSGTILNSFNIGETKNILRSANDSVFVTTNNNVLIIMRMIDADKPHMITFQDGKLEDISISPDGQFIAVKGENGMIHVIDISGFSYKTMNGCNISELCHLKPTTGLIVHGCDLTSISDLSSFSNNTRTKLKDNGARM